MDMISIINEEIENKRIKPEYLSELLISGLEKLEKHFDATYPEIVNYRREFNKWKAFSREPLTHIEEINRKTSEILSFIKKSSKRIKKEKYFAKDQEILESLVADLDSEPFDMQAWSKINNEKLNALLINRQELLFKLESSIKIGNGLINNSIFKLFIQILIFSIAFMFSYLIGDKFESELSQLGSFIAKLISAIIFYFSIDKLVKSIEEKLEWRRVKFLRDQYVELQEIINNQTSILIELKKNHIH